MYLFYLKMENVFDMLKKYGLGLDKKINIGLNLKFILDLDK